LCDGNKCSLQLFTLEQHGHEQFFQPYRVDVGIVFCLIGAIAMFRLGRLGVTVVHISIVLQKPIQKRSIRIYYYNGISKYLFFQFFYQ